MPSRRRSLRASKRRARFRIAVVEFNLARESRLTFEDHVKSLVRRDVPVWPIAEAVSAIEPLTYEERAMICQIVAPELVRRTPRIVQKADEKVVEQEEKSDAARKLLERIREERMIQRLRRKVSRIKSQPFGRDTGDPIGGNAYGREDASPGGAR